MLGASLDVFALNVLYIHTHTHLDDYDNDVDYDNVDGDDNDDSDVENDDDQMLWFSILKLQMDIRRRDGEMFELPCC